MALSLAGQWDKRDGLVTDPRTGGKFHVRGGVKTLSNTLYRTDGQAFSSVGNIQCVYYGDPRTRSATGSFRL